MKHLWGFLYSDACGMFHNFCVMCLVWTPLVGYVTSELCLVFSCIPLYNTNWYYYLDDADLIYMRLLDLYQCCIMIKTVLIKSIHPWVHFKSVVNRYIFSIVYRNGICIYMCLCKSILLPKQTWCVCHSCRMNTNGTKACLSYPLPKPICINRKYSLNIVK